MKKKSVLSEDAIFVSSFWLLRSSSSTMPKLQTDCHLYFDHLSALDIVLWDFSLCLEIKHRPYFFLNWGWGWCTSLGFTLQSTGDSVHYYWHLISLVIVLLLI